MVECHRLRAALDAQSREFWDRRLTLEARVRQAEVEKAQLRGEVQARGASVQQAEAARGASEIHAGYLQGLLDDVISPPTRCPSF